MGQGDDESAEPPGVPAGVSVSASTSGHAGASTTAPPPAAVPRVAAAGVWRWLGRVPFATTASLQEKLRDDLRAGVGPESLLLLEHEGVITLGRSAAQSNVLHSEAALAAQGITIHRASRGGDVTYHGPGQLVGYPVIRLRTGVRAYVEAMAAALIEVLGELGIAARYKKEAPGLWVTVGAGGCQGNSEAKTEANSEAKTEAKICAFGVNVHHRITMHGFALNLDPDLNAFRLIVPCGIVGAQVTSVRALRGTSPTARQVSARVAEALGAHLGVSFNDAEALTNCNAPPGH